MLDGAIPVDRAVMAKMDINRLIEGSAPGLGSAPKEAFNRQCTSAVLTIL